jgi:hypothetical protein
MVICQHCNKNFNTQRGLNQHISRSKICNKKILTTSDEFHYFDQLPIEFKIECMMYLTPTQLYACYLAKIDIFSLEYNNYWKPLCEKIKMKRRIEPTSYAIMYIKLKNSFCFDCWKKTTCLDHFFQIPICYGCRKDNLNLKMITKTTAKTEYHLTDIDLKKLEYFETKNPHYRCGSNMTLFLESDVKKYVDEKYGESFENIKLEKETKKAKRKKNKENKKTIRRSELSNELQKVGLKIRNDSKLCENYIDGSLSNEWSLKKVVDMCCEMHWLYNYTNYKKKLNRSLNNEIEICKSWDGRYYFSDIYDDVEPTVRNKIIKENGGLPIVYPWLKKNDG